MSDAVKAFMKGIKAKNAGETEFHQAVEEVVTSLLPYMVKHSNYRKVLRTAFSSPKGGCP